jgi:hypothetical protein
MTLGQLKDEDFTVAAIKSAMLNEERRRITATASSLPTGSSDYTALAAQQLSSPSVDRAQLTCNWCGLSRHLEHECHRKSRGEPRSTPAEKEATRKQSAARRNRRNRSANKNSEANIAEEDSGNIYLALRCTDDDSDTPPSPSQSTSQCMRAESAPASSPSVTAKKSVTLHSGGARGGSETDWYVDSAASFHYCRHRDWFDTFNPLEGESVSLGDGHRIPIVGQGDISAHVPVSSTASAKGLFTNVQYAPALAANLLSVSAMAERGLSATFLGRVCTIRNQRNKVIGRAVRVANKLYQLTLSRKPSLVATKAAPQSQPSLTATKAAPGPDPSSKKALMAQQTKDFLQQWHSRFGHVSHETIRQLFKQHMGKDVQLILGDRLKVLEPAPAGDPLPACNACHLGKSHRASLPKASIQHSKAPLELVHTDICGPFRTPSLGGAVYFMLIIDDFSRYIWIRALRAKSEAEAAFKAYKAQAEREHHVAGHCIKAVRFDGEASTTARASEPTWTPPESECR